jgi:hypothetical protein
MDRGLWVCENWAGEEEVAVGSGVFVDRYLHCSEVGNYCTGDTWL